MVDRGLRWIERALEKRDDNFIEELADPQLHSVALARYRTRRAVNLVYLVICLFFIYAFSYMFAVAGDGSPAFLAVIGAIMVGQAAFGFMQASIDARTVLLAKSLHERPAPEASAHRADRA